MAEITEKHDLLTASPKNLTVKGGRVEFKLSSREIDDDDVLAELLEPAVEFLGDYQESDLDPAIEKVDEELDGLRDAKEAQALTRKANAELKKLADNLKKQAERRIEKESKKLQKEDKDLAGFKLKTVVKIVPASVELEKSVAKGIATGGAKEGEYGKLGKSAVGVAKSIAKGLDAEARTRKTLVKALAAMSKAKAGGKVDESTITRLKEVIKLYEKKLARTQKDAAKLADQVEGLIDLGGSLELSRKQSLQLDDLLEQTTALAKLEKDCTAFAGWALRSVQEQEGKWGLRAVRGDQNRIGKGLAQKLEKEFYAARKVFERAGTIL